MNALQILWQYREAFFHGLVVTLQLVTLTLIVGTAVGAGLEWLCHRFRPIRRILDVIAFSIAAIPALVLLFWLYYPAQALVGISISPFLTAFLALTIINTFSVYRIIADAVNDFPKQYVATALVCGLNRLQILRYIQGPLLIRAVLPRWIDQQVIILQTSVFASLISVEELFRVAQRINSQIYQPVVIYTSMALIYMFIAGFCMYIAKYLRNKFYRDLSER
jgi:polar amino acid transport system permease protein